MSSSQVNRRSFLATPGRLFVDKGGDDASNPDSDFSDPEVGEVRTETRRGVLKIIKGSFLAAGLLSLTGWAPIERRNRRLKKEAEALIEKAKREDKMKYLETAVVSELYMVGEDILTKIGDAMGIDSGNAGAEIIAKLSADSPLVMAAFANVIGPVIEEAMFREVPYRRFYHRIQNGQSIGVGLASSVAFALMHNLQLEAPFVDLDRLPLQQFFAGLFFWYLRVEKGLDHAILAHVLQNSTIDVVIALQKLFGNPEEDEEIA